MAYDPAIFDIVRKRLKQQAGAGAQESQQAAARQFARQGLSGSGAAIKTEQQLLKNKEDALGRAEETANLAELQEKQRQSDITEAREFARQERLGSQEFGAQQAGINRAFSREERIAGQQFQSYEAAEARGFSKELFDLEIEFKKEAQKIQESQFGKQMDLAIKNYNLEFDAQEFNKNMAEKQFNKKGLLDYARNPAEFLYGSDGMFGSLFGPYGSQGDLGGLGGGGTNPVSSIFG